MFLQDEQVDDKSVINHNKEQLGEQLKEIECQISLQATKLSELQTEVVQLKNEFVSQMRILNAKLDTFFQLLPYNVNLYK